MDRNERKNRNWIKTENAIKDSLILLCNEHQSITKVTVKELCERANISKSTFYLHYDGIENIFNTVGDHFILAFDEIFEKLTASGNPDFLFFIRRLVVYVNESSELIKIGLAYSPSLTRYIENIKVQLEKAVYRSPLLKKLTISNKQMLIEVKIIAGGIIDFIIDLLRSNRYNQLEANAHAIDDYINRWIKSISA